MERWTYDRMNRSCVQILLGVKAAWQPWTSCSHLCASVTKQYNLVPAKGRWCSATGKVTAGMGMYEMAAYRRVDDLNGESTSMVWPTLGSRTAKEQNRTLLHSKQTVQCFISCSLQFISAELTAAWCLLIISSHHAVVWQLLSYDNGWCSLICIYVGSMSAVSSQQTQILVYTADTSASQAC